MTNALICAIALASEPKLLSSGAINYRPNVVWTKAGQATSGPLILSLFTSAKSINPGQEVWIQSMFTNQSQKTIRIPVISLDGGFSAWNWLSLHKGTAAINYSGLINGAVSQIVSTNQVRESRFFTIKPGQTVVLRTDSISGYHPKPIRKEILAKSLPVNLQSGEYQLSVSYEIEPYGQKLKPGEYCCYGGKKVYHGQSKLWHKNAPKGPWKIETTLQVN